MKNFITKPSQTQALCRNQRAIYQILIRNINKSKKNQEDLTLSTIRSKVFYALSTVKDSLQVLRKLGLVYYCKVKRVWIVTVSKLQDAYDFYITEVKDKGYKLVKKLGFIDMRELL